MTITSEFGERRGMYWLDRLTDGNGDVNNPAYSVWAK